MEASADKALHQFGTNAIPTLLRMLRARDSPLTLKIVEFVRKEPFIKVKFKDAARRNYIACQALQRLGRDAKSAMSALIEVYERDLLILSRTTGRDASAARRALLITEVWGRMGPGARDVIPLLLRGATNSLARVRWIALSGLGAVHAEPKIVVPVLAKALQDPDSFVKSSAAVALTQFGVDAAPAVPALAELLADPDSWTQDAGLRALRHLHANAEAAVPALAAALNSTNHNFALDVAFTLEAYGPAARAGIQTNPARGTPPSQAEGLDVKLELFDSKAANVHLRSYRAIPKP
jgi:hypothetical protein